MNTKIGEGTAVAFRPEFRDDSRQLGREVKAILFVALAVAGGAASAQNAGSQQIEEVVVTATRREQSFQDVPMAVSALTSQQLLDAGVNEFQKIEAQVPSLEIESNTNPFNTSLRIRGVGNLANIPNFEPAVGLFIDNAYRSRSGVAMGDLLDVERIEVLRGPQSVLYPKNVTAGLINVITNRPTDDFSVWGGASFGNLDYWQLQGGINGALTDGVRGRLAAVTSDRDGSFNDIVNGTHSGGYSRTALRGQLEFDLGERATLRLIAGYSNKDGDCCSPDVLPGPVSKTFLGALKRPVDTDPLNRRTAYSDPNHFEGDQYDLLADLNYEFDWAVLTSTTSLDHFDVKSQFDAEQSALTAAVFIDRQEADAFGQEFRLTSTGDGPLSWMTGAYFYDNDFTRGSLGADEPILVLGADVVPLPLVGAPGDQSSFKSQNDTRHWSLFGQLDWQATERTKLSAGLRYIDEKKSIDVRSTYRVAAVTVPPSFAMTTTVPTPVVADRSTDGLAWNLSALFDVTADTTVYATVSEGYKAGGYNGDWDQTGALTAAKREFEDETVLNLETGLKSRFWNDQATLNLSLFRSEFEDYQNASFLGVNYLVRNAEKVISQGLELDGSVRPVTGLTLDYAVTYLDAEYDKFTNGACYFRRNGTATTCDLSGETLPNAPDWRTNLGVQYEHALASGTGFVRTDWAYTSEQNADTALDPRALQDAYSLWSARLGWRNGRYSVTLWGENLTDETVISAAGPQTIFGGIDGGMQIYLNEPRTYGVTMDVRF